MRTRTERDSMGEVEVPDDALYGAQTRRAILNFPVSGWALPKSMIRALGLIKRAAAQTNYELGKLDAERTAWIESAAGEVIDGKLDGHFPVDVFQTGSATSSNMNANEVIANRAIELAGGKVGSKNPVHPNDHVNMGQSSNDVMPTALHVAAATSIKRDLLPALQLLQSALAEKADIFANFVKIGRTHLQDATPITMGQVFSGYTAQIKNSIKRLHNTLGSLSELPLGGTAVGTGLNTHPKFALRVISKLSEETGIAFFEADNHFEAQAARDAMIEGMGTLKTLAVSLNKIANDIRFLASGPRCGYGELQLPEIQPGSSIMPGKVNPVICESVMQVAAFVVGAEASASFSAGTLSNFELAVNIPLLAYNFLEAVRLLANACRMFVSQALEGLACHVEACEGYIDNSLAMCTSLAPILGYDQAADIAKTAYATGRTVREVALESGAIDKATLDQALDPISMTRPSK